ncbi:MAG: hypothetical protein U0805_11725 [Pirellulales bacterium]
MLTVVLATVTSNESTQADFVTIINVPPAAPVSGIVSGTQLNLFDGGALSDYFQAGLADVTSTDLELNVYGGTIGANLLTQPGTKLNLSGGLIGQWYTAVGSNLHVTGGRIVNNFTATNSTIQMSAGQVDALFNLQGASVLNLTGGSIGSSFRLWPGAEANISGGVLGTLAADPSTIVNITGGTIGSASVDGEVHISGGSFAPSFVASSLSHVEIQGGEFRLNGNLISGLSAPNDFVPFNLTTGNTLSGTLADGTPFAFTSWDSDSFAAGVVKLKAVALPAIGSPVIVASTRPVPLGIREGQTLIVDAGAAIPASFNAGRGSTVNVQTGGTVGANLEAVTAAINVNGGTTNNVKLYVGATMNVNTGIVGRVLADRTSLVNISGGTTSFLDVISGSKLTLTGGTLAGLNAQSGGIVNISGGVVGNTVKAFGGSNVSISGGRIGNDLTCSSGSTIAISGGAIGDRFVAASGSAVIISGASFGDAFKNSAGSAMRLVGREFRLTGASALAAAPVGATTVVTLNSTDVLSGVFSDGTPFAFSPADGDTIGSVTLVAAQLPAVGNSVINVAVPSTLSGVRGGQQLNVLSGGQLPASFNAGAGSSVRIFNGAAVGPNFESVSGNVDILGGNIGENFDALWGSTVNVFGGNIGASFGAHNGSVVNIRGGIFGNLFEAFAGSTVNFFGRDFFINGTPISGLIAGQQFLFTTRTGTLSGRFADGTAFSFSLQTAAREGPRPLLSPNAQVTLTLVPEPSSGLLCALCIMLASGKMLRVARHSRLRSGASLGKDDIFDGHRCESLPASSPVWRQSRL